jgi:hypothetical protein
MTQPVQSFSAERGRARRARRAAVRSAQRWLARLAAPSYPLSRALFQLHLRLAELTSGQPLLVYQVGKVGSTTVVRSLRAAGWKQPIYHLHTLHPDVLSRDEALYRRQYTRGDQRARHLWTSQYLLPRLEGAAPRGRPWMIVTLVRDPVARNLSGFFQTMRLEFDWAPAAAPQAHPAAQLQELRHLFLEKVEWHDDPLTWFDAEIKRTFGIDVYASDFPKERGYHIYVGDRARLLVLKLELLDQCAPEAFESFLNLKGFNLANANLAAEKDYSSLYRRFLAAVALPDSYLDRMYTSRFVCHFYTVEEIARFRSRWRRRAEGRRGAPASHESQ